MNFLFDKDVWHEIAASLKKSKLRTFLTAFGVIWGIFMLMVLLGAGAGFENNAKYQWGSFATNSMFINAETTTIPYKGYPRGRRFTFNTEDCELVKNRFEDIQYFSSGVYVSGGFGNSQSSNVIVRGKQTASFAVLGVEPDRQKIDPLDFTGGRFINDLDFENKRKVCVIGERVYNTLFKPGEDPVGEYIKINNVYFQVIGNYKSMHSGGWGNWQNGLVIMPRNTAQQTFNLGDDVYWMSICAKDGVSVGSMKDDILKMMAERHSVSPEDKMAFDVDDIEEEYKKGMKIFAGIKIFIWIVGVFTLLAGVIGISNIMLISIKERTREIGIRRALGAKPFAIIAHVIAEASVLTFIAGYAGLMLGVGMVELANKIIGGEENDVIRNPEIGFEIAVFSLVIIVVSGVLAGLIPSLRAISIKPVDAIRD